ncbi:MAG: hypothetical protein IT180_17425 [Acidobacteria bacterium]|nr:hypothetical protein [Acidobacteriota bacterium]
MGGPHRSSLVGPAALADRAALDVASARGLATGGSVSRGREAEDGVIPARYVGLREAGSSDPVVLRDTLDP